MDWRFQSAVPGIAWPTVPDYGRAAVLALLHQLDQSQWLPAERLEAEQLRQLDALLRHAWETVPFYRQSWASSYDGSMALSLEKFAGLPTLTRLALQESYEALKSRSFPGAHGRAAESRSSGSTGMPVRILKTEITGLFWNALTLRDHVWHGRDLSRKLAVIRRKTGGRAPNWGAATAGLVHTGECVMRDVDTDVEAQLDWLVSEQPGYLLTYPSLAAELAKASLRRGVRLPGLLEVRTLAEGLGPDVRALCREAWGVALVDFYSAEEVGYIALQCPRHEHYHVQAESLLVEVLDERGEPCLPGQVGRVVVTDLHNFALPLIRYDIGDYAEVGAPCDCGRGLPVLSRIAGRVRNMLVTAGGKRFWPPLGSRKFIEVAPVLQHQIAQKDYDLLEARLVTAQLLDASQEERLRQMILAGMPAGMRLVFRYCDSIPRGAGGKFEDFVCEVAGGATR
jgi:phenylacetate-CoA ligase